jgi:hypothetical protein
MINYLNILEIWDVVEKYYIPKYNPDTNILTTESLIVKRENNNTISSILNSVSESVALLFAIMINANEI